MRGVSLPDSEDLTEGTRVGRLVTLRNVDGRHHVATAGAVVAFHEEDGDVFLHAGDPAMRPAVSLTTVLD
ncbi:hypothetical protein ACFQX4_00210 [Roseomonas sp. GCM10028921]